jgi:hypothetical protein
MRRGEADFLGLSWTALFGIIFAVAFIILAWPGTSFADIILHWGDDKKVEESMDFLQNQIYNLNVGERKEIAFYSNGEQVYLMTFNKNYQNPLDCYDSACIVLCSDQNCDTTFFVKKLPDGIEFENPGEVAYLGSDEEVTTNLAIENINGKVKIGFASVDCNIISDCYSYSRDEVACVNNPCGVGGGYGCMISEIGTCMDVKDNEPLMVG